MLRYSTRFKVKDLFTKEQFVKSVIKWCTEKKYPMENLESHFSELSFFEIYENQTLEVINCDTINIIAARHTAETSKGTWTVDAVLNYREKLITVCMDHTVNENTEDTNSHRRVPWLINHIITDGFAADNMGFELKNSALSFDASNASTLFSAIESDDPYSLPIVYLSSRSKLNADSIALKLSGLAVVIKDMSDVLRTTDSNRFCEPIYVFIPHKMIEPIPFDDYPLHRDIIRVIADYLNSRKYDKLETWNGLNSEVFRLNSQGIIKKLKEQCSDTEFNQSYLSNLELENEEYAKKYDKLAADFRKLQLENERLNYNLEVYSESGTSVIISGKEKDFYPNEQREIIMEILLEYLNKSVSEECRRADIIKSLIKANPIEGIPDKYKKLIKKAFDGYQNFSCTKIINALKETGIDVVNHTGHYKLQYHSDPRYTFEAAATPSDSRAGKNAASIINKLMF